MGLASLVCTYLYGSFMVIKNTLEGYIRIAKNLIKKVDKLATTIMNLVRSLIDKTMSTMLKLIKQYEKELIDMITDAIGLTGKDHWFWCNRLWNCVALLTELLDSNSWLNRKILDYMNRHCMSTKVFNAMDVIAIAANDINVFRETVCNAGFTVEFGISYIKQLFMSFKAVVEEYLSFLERYWKRLRLAAEEYLNIVIDWGVMDYLEKLLSFFTCAFDDSVSCAEIATASNFYQDTMSKLKLEKHGDGYDLSREYRNSIYGGLEGGVKMCKDFEREVDAAMDKCIDPKKLKRANDAVNLSKHVFPGGMSWSDLREGRWEKHYLAKLYHIEKEKLKAAWRNKFGQDETITNIIDSIEYDEDGHVYAVNGCTRTQLDPFDDPLPEPEYTTVITDSPIGHSMLMDKDGKIYTLWEAALEVKDGTSDFAKECIAYAELLNDWTRNPNGAIRYNDQVFV